MGGYTAHVRDQVALASAGGGCERVLVRKIICGDSEYEGVPLRRICVESVG